MEFIILIQEMDEIRLITWTSWSYYYADHSSLRPRLWAAECTLTSGPSSRIQNVVLLHKTEHFWTPIAPVTETVIP